MAEGQSVRNFPRVRAGILLSFVAATKPKVIRFAVRFGFYICTDMVNSGRGDVRRGKQR